MNIIKRLLIANRGEIACRIIRTAKAQGIHTIAIYSDIDANAQHVVQADEAHCIGPAPAAESYLKQASVIEVARKAEADAIHPGYGFLSENADFAALCEQHNIRFIGPPKDAIRAMGSKSQAKAIMAKADVPITAGYHGDNQSLDYLAEQAEKIGYPVMLKASAGGGGKGMRIVDSASDFAEQLATAKREAMKSFSNEHMLVEKYIEAPRHIEIQVFCDSYGNAVYLFDRDCSIQRRHQKIIEEAPAPNISEATREAMGQAAVKAAQAIGYIGAGTVEFLLDKNEHFYFMEMNTRLQVEHPVTEMITGQDLVLWQLLVASGEPLPLSQSSLTQHGHAIEARVYAEDPEQDFLPQTGELLSYAEPKGENIRVDSGVTQGDKISVYYDPMISKVISFADQREDAIQQLNNALAEYEIIGCRTNINYLQSILRHQAFANAELTTQFIELHQHSLRESSVEPLHAIAVAVLSLYHLEHTTYPIGLPTQFRLNVVAHTNIALDNDINATITKVNTGFVVSYNSQETRISNWHMSHNYYRCVIENRLIQGAFVMTDTHLHLRINGEVLQWQRPSRGNVSSLQQDDYVAPMNGTIVQVNVSVGEKVLQGDTLIIMEAMKMEHAIKASSNGQVSAIHCQTDDLIEGGVKLIDITTQDAE